MAAGDLITLDYELEYNGVVTGDTNTIHVRQIDIFSGAEVRQKSLNRPLDHGAFATDAFYGPRTVRVEFEVWGTSEATLATNLDKALELTVLTETDEPLVVQLPSFGKFRFEGRCIRRASSPVNHDYQLGYFVTFICDYFVPDPRILGNTLNSSVLTKTTASGNLTYNLTYNLNYGSSGTSGTNINNAGMFEARPTVTVNGPFTSFNLENVTQGKKLEFSDGPDAGQNVVIDFYARTVFLNGTASRYNWVKDSTQWWTLQPGNNEIRLNGSSTGTPTATIEWRDSRV